LTALLRVILVIALLCLSMAVHAGGAKIWSGEELYYTCAACHGSKGEGLTPRHAPKIAGLEAWYLERQINNYKAGIRGNHPGDLYGSQMILFARTLGNDDEVVQLARYIASLPRTPARQTIKGDLGRGGEIYATCTDCHGQRGEGNKDSDAPRLAGTDDWYLASQLRNFRAGALGYSDQDRLGKQMADSVRNPLIDDASIMDVVAYINFLGTDDSTSKR